MPGGLGALLTPPCPQAPRFADTFSRLGAGEKAEAPETQLLGLPLPAYALWERTVLPGRGGGVAGGPGSMMEVQSGPHGVTDNRGLCTHTGATRPRGLTQRACLSAEFPDRSQEGASSAPHSRAAWAHLHRTDSEGPEARRPNGEAESRLQGREGHCRSWVDLLGPLEPTRCSLCCAWSVGTHRLSKPSPTRFQSAGRAGAEGGGRRSGRGKAQAGLSGS